ncbi:acyltransferase family protein [Colwellia sp. 75C3]|uniref:acyltransferase family protein n=1 Tax=Colwellia sp. 75C3 TaxID=888425 RepID=UPI0012FF12F6|nr:acyltransferase [Colwellia sp. 75C3]
MDIVRGLAALWVFFYHSKQIFAQSSPLLYELAKYGHLGVPMFFVISGYVIAYSAESSLSKNASPKDFLKKRFLRIYPTFWASIIVVILMPYAIEFIAMFKSGTYIQPISLLSKMSSIEWLYFVSLTKVFFSNGSNVQEQFNAINSVYWSLAIEFQFYLLVYLALHFKKHFKKILLIVTGASFLNQVLGIELSGGLFIHYWQMFACGLALAYLHKGNIYFQKIVTKHTLIISSLLNIIILISLITYIDFNLTISNFSFAVIFVLMLWIVAPFEDALVQLKRGRITKYFLELFLILGAMSYSVYLLHAKLYQIPEMFVRQIIEPSNIAYGILTIVLTIVLCAPFYYFIERSFMSKNYSKIHKNIIS